MHEASSTPSSSAAARRAFRIWLFDDHRSFRELLADYLGRLPGLTVAGTGDDEPVLETALDAGLVDLVLMDLNLRGPGGFRVIERLRQRPRPPAVLVLSSEATRHSVSTDRKSTRLNSSH